MYKEELNEAFSKFRASENLEKRVLLADAGNARKRPGGNWIWRAAACAAVLVMLFASWVLGNSTPYFSVKVYASETDSMEMDRKGRTFFLPVKDVSNESPQEENPLDRPIFDAYVGEGGKIFDDAGFFISLWLNDETMDYSRLSILVNGIEVEPSSEKLVLSGTISNDEAKGCWFAVEVKETERIDMILYADDGSVLQHYGMVVKPVEGGWSVTMDKTYMALIESNLLKSWTE